MGLRMKLASSTRCRSSRCAPAVTPLMHPVAIDTHTIASERLPLQDCKQGHRLTEAHTHQGPIFTASTIADASGRAAWKHCMSCSLTGYAQPTHRKFTCSSGAAKALASAELRPSGRERDSRDTRAGAGRRAVRCMCRVGVGSLRAARPPRASYGSRYRSPHQLLPETAPPPQRPTYNISVRCHHMSGKLCSPCSSHCCAAVKVHFKTGDIHSSVAEIQGCCSVSS